MIRPKACLDTITLFVLLALAGLSGCGATRKLDAQFQRDADIVRARHLMEWAEIIEAYHTAAGHYPLQDRVDGDEIVLVQIATREQQRYLDPQNPKYRRELDNKSADFTVVSVKDFVAEIEDVLKRDIDERYDPQRVPNGAPNYLSYFVSKNGYLIWTVCRTAPPTANSFTTLLDTGTPSINIGSEWFVENMPKVQSLAGLQANKEFLAFMGGGPVNPGWFEQLERAQVDESKK